MVNRYNPDIHHRRSIRLQGYDYSQSNAYFITICVQNREYLFGEITDEEMQMNEYGRIVRDEWLKTAEIRQGIELGAFVVMPNHFHGILSMHDLDGGHGTGTARSWGTARSARTVDARRS